MTTTTPPDPTPPISTDTVVGPATDRTDGRRDTAGGDIARLNAFDGLFLRAEHLTAMQDYARDLTYALGAAGGPGVVDGYDVTPTEKGLQVDAGLAVSASGRPLRSRSTVVLPWAMFTPPKDGWFRIEVGPADWGYDEATVQALLCDAPCSGGTRATVYLAEGVRIFVETATDPGFTGERGWLASHLFGKEEEDAAAWPGTATGTILEDLIWRPPPPAVLSERVPLAVVIPTVSNQKKWIVDVWAVRRDRGAPPPDDRWRWRLAMRPWPVFVAQILQFQDHYAAVGQPRPDLSLLDKGQVESELSTMLEQIRGSKSKDPTAQLEALLAQFAATGGGLKPAVLPDVGITELPPAGLLRVGEVEGRLDDGVRAEVDRLLAGGADIRVQRCGPGDIGLAIEQARHRRRIPIGDRQHPTPVDILLPVEKGERIGNWVVFVRRDDIVTAEVEEVDLYLVDDRNDPDKFANDRKAAEAGTIPDGAGDPVVLRYSVGSWTQPQGDQRAVLDRIQKLKDGTPVVVALNTEESRWALGEVRAALLTIQYREQAPGAVHPLVDSFSAAARDAIVFIVGPPQVVDG